MEDEVARFAAAIGAVPMNLQCSHDERRLFARPNYYQVPAGNLVIKISRKTRPFWGVGAKQIEVLEQRGPYYLILLVSDKEGWCFSGADVQRNISAGKWKVGHDNNYKINMTLPDKNAFASNAFAFTAQFLQKIG